MPSLNKVILIGNICQDLELKQTQSGVSVCSFSIGIQRKYKNADGKYESDFITVVTWRETAEFVAKKFSKGKAICVCGALQQRSWTDQQGTKKYTVEVVADEINFVGSKEDAPTQAEKVAQATAPSKNAEPADDKGGFVDIDENSDDLPF